MDISVPYRSYDYFKYEVLKYQESKLFDDNIVLDVSGANIISLTPDERIQFINKYKVEYDDILYYVKKYKFKKDKLDENSSKDHYVNEILSKHLDKVTKKQRKEIALTILLIKKTGKLYKPFVDSYIEANVFYRKKDKFMRYEPSNSRCMIACDNRLKIITRYLKDIVLEDIFLSGKINTNINRVKKCYITYEDKKGILIKKLRFESISNIACIIHKSPYKFMLLDLSNAFNNVYYDFLNMVLLEYLENPDYVNGITELIKHIKYYDPKLKMNIKRNKGIPQGSSVSTDLFVICMDYIIKKVIIALCDTLDLKYNVDYKIIIYVDDILIMFKTDKAELVCIDIFNIFKDTFAKYKFILNDKKSKCSAGLSNSILKVINDDDKYLGVYYCKDIDKYLSYLDEEIKVKALLNGKIRSLQDCETFFDELTVKNKLYLAGKLRYRLSPFVSSTIKLNNVLSRYENISTLFT